MFGFNHKTWSEIFGLLPWKRTWFVSRVKFKCRTHRWAENYVSDVQNHGSPNKSTHEMTLNTRKPNWFELFDVYRCTWTDWTNRRMCYWRKVLKLVCHSVNNWKYHGTSSTFIKRPRGKSHYSDVIMSTMVSQIVSIVYSNVCSGADQRKHQAPRHSPLCGEYTGDQWIPRTKDQ